MVKNIIIGLLTLITIFFIIYAQIQTGFAEESMILAQQEQMRADELTLEAQRQAAIANEMAAKVRVVEHELLNCKKRSE